MYKASVFRYFIALVLVGLLLVPVDCFAQQKEIVITVKKKDENDNISLWKGVDVYGFNSSKKANIMEQIYQKCKKSGSVFIVDDGMYDTKDITNEEGFCTMMVARTGYLCIIAEGGLAFKKVPIEGKTEVIVTLDGTKEIGTVNVSAKMPVPPPPKIEVCGNRVEMFYPIPIDSTQTDGKSRMVIVPVCSIVETGENLGYMQPVVFDGIEYQRANLRRMGFDESRDPLYYYRIPKFMETHKADTVPFHLLVEPIDVKLHYQVVGLQTFVSTSNIPYRVDSIMICDGSREDPMRFLDYSLIDIPMERARYEERGKPARNEDHAKLDLNFLQGEARLDPSDTLNIRKLRDLRTNLSRYNGATSSIDGVVIHGSASPEGGMAVNERLCRERAEFIRQQLNSFPELQEVRSIGGIKTTHKVATWADVANLLESDSLKDEAASVRGILSIVSDMRKQEEQIRRLPCWDYINTSILPRLRVADIQCDYITNRVKTKQEIWEQYQKDPDYHVGKKQQAYEFYQLLGMIENLVEKEVIAEAAYNSVERYGMPWLLAAYDLAQCYIARGHVDTTLLKPYIDITKRFDVQWRDMYGPIRFYYNDKAVVATQIKMYVMAGAYRSARILAEYLWKDDDQTIPEEYKKMKLFLKCLDCGWKDPKVVEMVSATSYWNNIVVTAAQNDVGRWVKALYMLNDPLKVNQADPKVLYMKAQMRFNIRYSRNKVTAKIKEEAFIFNSEYGESEDDPEKDMFGDDRNDYGLAMVQCCLLDPAYLEVLRWDGVFNKSYRDTFYAYWEKIQNGTEPKPKLPEPTAQETSGLVFDDEATDDETTEDGVADDEDEFADESL